MSSVGNCEVGKLGFRHLYSSTSMLSFLNFLRDSYFNCSRMSVMLVCYGDLHPNQQFFSHVRTLSCRPRLNQY